MIGDAWLVMLDAEDFFLSARNIFSKYIVRCEDNFLFPIVETLSIVGTNLRAKIRCDQ